ncbi:albusnodin family lasso peptide [Actinokineospora iranica]|uniref:Albusnodin family lasso peptide n=1 Tax=Actinokineospora iranica TaxID=1271860 RepID=A0A1G6VY52_9PSEU|nr:albusnodin family lasso peptide [Actinokineospora iranica]SDD57907.1 hypothetical protein SAMN05216174_113134 [Actinokineospora iranica]
MATNSSTAITTSAGFSDEAETTRRSEGIAPAGLVSVGSVTEMTQGGDGDGSEDKRREYA